MRWASNEYEDSEHSSVCPDFQWNLPEDDSANPSIMYYQYRATEFSARDVPGLWSAACEETYHWLSTGESPWETLVRLYTELTPDRADGQEWQFVTPMAHGSVLPGPNGLPHVLPAWPTVEIDIPDEPDSASVSLRLTLVDPDDNPVPGVFVMLIESDKDVISQGRSDRAGGVTVLGVHEGELILANKVDPPLSGSITVYPGNLCRSAS